MAIQTQRIDAASLSIMDRIFGTLRVMATAIVDAHSRRAEVDRLQAKSDAQLAEMGLSRDRIVHHVFRDLI